MGLPGSGKTTFAGELKSAISKYTWLNADIVRATYNDWDFSLEGRIRQATRMRDLAAGTDAIIDMVCPLPEMRSIINADITVWMDTISAGRYEDTNNMFVNPGNYHYRITAFDDATRASIIDKISSSPR